MVSRISTWGMQQQALDALRAQQADLARTQLQIATGRRILAPSDDPVGSQRVLELSSALERLVQYRTNGEVARVRLAIEENALATSTDVIHRARELVVQASNDSQSPETRRLIAVEIRELAESLMQAANTQNGEGEYIFAGFRSETAPFSRSSGIVTYNGDQGQRLIQIADGARIAEGDPGSDVFLGIWSGNGTFEVDTDPANTGGAMASAGNVTDPAAYDGDTYTIQFTSATDYDVLDGGGGLVTSGTYVDGDTIGFRGIEVKISGPPLAGDQFTAAPSRAIDAFEMLEAIAIALEGAGGSATQRAELRTDLGSGLLNLDQALERFVEVRTGVGSRLNAIETQNAAHDELELQFEATRADLRDLDYAEAITRLNVQLTGLQAAQQSFARIQGLTLFNFL